MLSESDSIRMRHMVEAAEEAIGFIKGRNRADLDTDHMLSFAIVRALEIIGEAASKVSLEGRLLCPSLPWASIVGMRHRIIHAYFNVDLDRVWDTVMDDLPPLIQELTICLPSDNSG